MADVIPFPRPAPKLNRHERRMREARGYDGAVVLNTVHGLIETHMVMAEAMAECARQGDSKAAIHFARLSEEVCELIELERDIRSGRPGRQSTLKRVTRRRPTRRD